jgi:hypothetical protein
VADLDGDSATLTIKQEYLAMQPTESLELTVEFDQGSPAVLVIDIIDSTPPVISPGTVTYDISSPGNVETAIAWNSARSVTGVVCHSSPLTAETDYAISGGTLISMMLTSLFRAFQTATRRNLRSHLITVKRPR